VVNNDISDASLSVPPGIGSSDVIQLDVTCISFEPDGDVGNNDAIPVIPHVSSSGSTDVIASNNPDVSKESLSATVVVISGEAKQCRSASADVAVNNEISDGNLSVPQDISSSDVILLTSSLASIDHLVSADGLESLDFRELIQIPKLTNRSERQWKRKVAHVAVVTSSPFKQALELAKKKKEVEKHPVVKKKVIKS